MNKENEIIEQIINSSLNIEQLEKIKRYCNKEIVGVKK